MTFYNEVIQKSPYFAVTSRVHDIAMLEPVTRKAVESIMLDAAAMGMPLILFETYRSVQRQASLFAQGATRLKTVGTHHYGIAADLVKNINGQPSWEGDFTFLGKLASKYGLIWGGDWGQPGVKNSFVDADHVQRIKVDDQNQLFAGAWYPDASYAVAAKAKPEKSA